MTVSMNWNTYLNGEAAGNLATIGTTKFHINKPLYLSTANSEKALVDNSEAVSVSLAGYYTITDAYKNVVFDSKGKNQKLFDFYGIKGHSRTGANMEICTEILGNLHSPEWKDRLAGLDIEKM